MKTYTVRLTERQLWLVVEQMEKGAGSWEGARFCRSAELIAKKLRRAVTVEKIKELKARLKLEGAIS